MNTLQDKLEIWAIVELFGHTKIAGKVTEQNIAGTNMLRVDVPVTKENPEFTRFFGSAAIYAINPVTEEVAAAYAERLAVRPIQVFEIDRMVEKKMLLLKSERTDSGYSHFEDEDDDMPY
ncbi:hypothetical protein [Arcticibacter sp.]|uniref:hypothetical protein n=1 Tax=Arcticibacter sp. TaxID=1872630 RepID=UPI003891164E